MAATKTIVLGGGCFWCTEAVFRLFPGIVAVEPGYAGGRTKNPTCEEVCSGTTGHAEVLRVEYDPAVLPLKKVLEIFFAMHDPTSVNRQGNDEGAQYRSMVLYTDDSDRAPIEAYIDGIRPAHKRPVVTEVVKLKEFYAAEGYHKDYYAHNRLQPYCMLVIGPKLKKIKEGIRSGVAVGCSKRLERRVAPRRRTPLYDTVISRGPA